MLGTVSCSISHRPSDQCRVQTAIWQKLTLLSHLVTYAPVDSSVDPLLKGSGVVHTLFRDRARVDVRVDVKWAVHVGVLLS